MIGWQGRNLHYVTRLKPLDTSRSPPTPKQRRGSGERAVLAMFDRVAAKQARKQE